MADYTLKADDRNYWFSLKNKTILRCTKQHPKRKVACVWIGTFLAKPLRVLMFRVFDYEYPVHQHDGFRFLQKKRYQSRR